MESTRLRVEIPTQHWKLVKRIAKHRRMTPARLCRTLLLEDAEASAAAEQQPSAEDLQRETIRMLVLSGFNTIAKLMKASGLSRVAIKARLDELKREASCPANFANQPQSSSLPSSTNRQKANRSATAHYPDDNDDRPARSHPHHERTITTC